MNNLPSGYSILSGFVDIRNWGATILLLYESYQFAIQVQMQLHVKAQRVLRC